MRVKGIQDKRRARGSVHASMAAALFALMAPHHGSAAPPSTGTTAGAGNYVLVTQRRPESPDKFFTRMRGVHELCAASAKLRHIVPKPFPAIPADFVDGRMTYARDGQRMVIREIGYGLDFIGGKPNDICAMRIYSTLSVTVIGNGQEQTTHLDDDGKLTVDEAVPVNAEAVRASRLALYTSPKTVNGVPLKCSAEPICIVDPALVLVVQGRRPVQAAWRNDDVATYGTPLIVEPVSLTVARPVDPALFSVGKSK